MWVSEGWLTAGGKRLEYACHGPPPGEEPTLVMLHEGLGCVRLWRDIPARLAALTGWGVCAYSRQGYGRSEASALPWPLDYMTREARDVLPDVLEAIGFRDGALLGHSDGASIAALHAGLVQDPRVRGVVLIAPHFFTETEGLAAIAAARQSFETGDLRGRLARYHEDVDCAFRGWCDSWLHQDFRSWDITHALDGVSVPVMVLQGDRDPYGTLAQVEVVSERCRASVQRVILEACGHAPHLEAPKHFDRHVPDFLKNMN